ncbi:response regulator transcription factor [Microbacterium sp. NIBRBAC000506063]|nr:LuxR C-terminal-related transcriptional regulator [Microbacterium sp. NIBRBAC000506063]
MSNAEMARTMHVSEGTVKAHLGSIMSKWQVRDRVQVLVTAARAGLVEFT